MKEKNIFAVGDGSRRNSFQLMTAIHKCAGNGSFTQVYKSYIFTSKEEFLFKDNEMLVHDYVDDWSHPLSFFMNKEDKVNESHSEDLAYLYKKYNTEIFKKFLKKDMNLSMVIYDEELCSLVAVGIGNNRLYYGYTKGNEIIYSNEKEILEELRVNIYEMPKNSYMIGNELYDFDGNKLDIDITKDDNDKTNKEGEVMEKMDERKYVSANSLLDNINNLINSIVDDSVKDILKKNVDDYIKSDDVNKKISDYLLKELDVTVKNELIKVIHESFIKEDIGKSVDQLLNERLAEFSKNVSVPVVHVINLKDVEVGRTKEGFFHEKFEQILTQLNLDEPIMLVGPAGSGKNVCISQVADALGLHMYYTNNASNEFKLTGFIDAGGVYRDTEFYKAFKNGGVFFLDEIDNSDPSALIVINSALANGYMAFPHETIERHPDFRVVAAANTWGRGADLQYVGRNALDGATLDRFDSIFFDYDKVLEKALYPNDEVLEFMWAFRESVFNTRIPHIVSTRGIGKVYKKEINGLPVSDILTSNVIKNLNQDDVNNIIGKMNGINIDNKFYSELKRIRVGR